MVNVIPSDFMGMLVGILVIVFVVIIAIYIYFAIALMAIAKKKKTPNAWLAWIPIANVYLMTQIGRLPGWYTLGILVGFVPFVGGIAVAVFMAYIWWKIAEAIGKPGWWGILMIIPIANLIIVGIMAWGK